MIPNLRRATEILESKYLDSELYSKLPNFLVEKIKDVALEDENNVQYKKLLKGADYLSADSECYRQYKAGSRDEYYVKTPLKNDSKKIETGAVVMPTACKEFFNTLYDYAKSLNLEE